MNMLTILQLVVSALLKAFPEDKVKEFVDKLLDQIEDHVSESGNKYDDLLIPIIKVVIRDPFNIPDNDEPIEGSEG